MAYNLDAGTKARREGLITVVEWDNGGQTPDREAIGAYAESSSIEFNVDKSKITDILGVVRSELRKTEPVQSLDTYYALAESALSEYLTDAILRNDLNKLEGMFTVYIIYTAMTVTSGYYAIRHQHCTITPDSIGGDGGSYVNTPLTIDFSNEITAGTVSSLVPSGTGAFTFTAETTTTPSTP